MTTTTGSTTTHAASAAGFELPLLFSLQQAFGCWYPFPRGSKYRNSRVLGSKIHTLNGFWTLKPHYLGTWTLRVLDVNKYGFSVPYVRALVSDVYDQGSLYPKAPK